MEGDRAVSHVHLLTWRRVTRSIFIFLASTVVTLFAIELRRYQPETRQWSSSALNALNYLDGGFYGEIARFGYSENRACFFPGYPMLVAPLVDMGVPYSLATIIVSWSSLFLAFLLADWYFELRLPNNPAVGWLALTALAFNPMGFAMHFAYSEATFLLFVAILLLLIEQTSSIWLVALCCGALTGIRPIGIAAVPVVLWYAWQSGKSIERRVTYLAVGGVVSVWGLVAFTIVLWHTIGDPLAFIHSQEPYAMRQNTLEEKVVSLATGGPLRRAIYDRTPSHLYGQKRVGEPSVMSNQVGDAVFWLLFAGLTIYGGVKRWITRYELLLSLGIIAIATWFQADRNNMACQGRFVSVVLPAYLVAGRLLEQCSSEFRLLFTAIALSLQFVYVTNFISGCFW
jgi:hypothetical protein